MNFDEYRALDAVNFSYLKKYEKSEKYANSKQADTDTPAKSFGRFAHYVLLESKKIDKKYAVWGGHDRRTKAGKEAWRELQEKLNGREVVSQQDVHRALLMEKSMLATDAASYIEAPGKAEHTIRWIAPDGTACKSRLDKLNDDCVVVDLKTTCDASFDKFCNDIGSYKYHAQLAFYLDAAEYETGKKHRAVIIAIESAPPFSCGVYSLNDEQLDGGRVLYNEWLAAHHRVRESGQCRDINEGKEIEAIMKPWHLPHPSLTAIGDTDAWK